VKDDAVVIIDEARTPLIISGPAEDAAEMYEQVNKLIPMLEKEHFEKDEKQRTVMLTESGTEHIEQLLEEADMLGGAAMYDITNISIVHHVNQALKAHTLF